MFFMKFLLPPPTSIAAFAREAGCRRAWNVASRRADQARCMSSTYEAYAEALAKRKASKAAAAARQPARGGARTNSGGEHAGENENEQHVGGPARGLSFPALGLDPAFVRAVQTAFPDVQVPTGIQEQLIPEILAGKDVLLRDATGSGKSFGLVLALLSKPRIVIHETDGSTRRAITALIVVPHKDLALQLHHWIERLVSAMRPAPVPTSIVQVLVRGADRPLDSALAALRATPPHVLVCTPQALQEAVRVDRAALQLDTLRAVAVDEVDYLIETVARKEVGKSFQRAFEKAVRKVARHPGPTREILDAIYAPRRVLAQRPYVPEEDNAGRWDSVEEWRSEKEREAGLPQLILSSATLRVHLKDYLFGESGWLNPYNVVKVMGDTSNAKRNGWNADRRILHSVVIASDTEIRNIDGAVAVPAEEKGSAEASGTEDEEGEVDGKGYYNEKYGQTPSPFDANALEAIATGFALDVPSIALLVIPSSAPVQRAVWELREMGVDAEMLDVEASGRGGAYLLGSGVDVMRANPRLLVATLASTRGLDLPALTHVFVLGLAEGPHVNGRSVDAYVHIAGRVGRFGRAGRVVSVVGSEAEGAKVGRILTTLGARPVRFEHFD